MTTPDPAQLTKAQGVVRDALRSQGARHPRAQTDALAEHLMNGGKPATYAERFAQMQLQLSGLLTDSQEAPDNAHRVCIECGAGPLMEGYYMGDEPEPHYRCNEHPIAGWPEQYSDDGQSYWTEWEE